MHFTEAINSKYLSSIKSFNINSLAWSCIFRDYTIYGNNIMNLSSIVCKWTSFNENKDKRHRIDESIKFKRKTITTLSEKMNSNWMTLYITTDYLRYTGCLVLVYDIILQGANCCNIMMFFLNYLLTLRKEYLFVIIYNKYILITIWLYLLDEEFYL